MLAAREAVADANASDDRLVWAAPPAIRKLMAGREKVSTSGRMLWEDDKVDVRPAFQTTAMPAATLLLGDLSKVTLGVWGQGIQVEITDKADATHFMAGITTMRVLAGVDVAVRQPACLHVTSSIT